MTPKTASQDQLDAVHTNDFVRRRITFNGFRAPINWPNIFVFNLFVPTIYI